MRRELCDPASVACKYVWYIDYIQCIKHVLEDLSSPAMWFSYLMSSNKVP